MKNNIIWGCLALLVCLHQNLSAQQVYRVQGNGLYQTPSSTNVDIHSEDDNTNSLLRFGDNNTSKVSLGYNGNEDNFKISTSATLGADDLSMTLTGRIGVNIAPSTHRLLIQQNSGSGINGDAQLAIQENNGSDNSRLRFTNLGEDDGFWEVRSAAINNFFQMDFYYTDGLNEAIFLSFDGDEESVGIHQTSPEGYLHLKQQFAGLDALAFTNDNNSNKWSMRIGDEDILIYFNGGIRGGFDVSTGNYNNFPPAPALSGQTKMKNKVLDQVMQLQAIAVENGSNSGKIAIFNPYEVEQINNDWVVQTESGQVLGLDYMEFSVLAIKTIQEQQEVMDRQARRIAALKARKAERIQRLQALEDRVR